MGADDDVLAGELRVATLEHADDVATPGPGQGGAVRGRGVVGDDEGLVPAGGAGGPGEAGPLHPEGDPGRGRIGTGRSDAAAGELVGRQVSDILGDPAGCGSLRRNADYRNQSEHREGSAQDGNAHIGSLQQSGPGCSGGSPLNSRRILARQAQPRQGVQDGHGSCDSSCLTSSYTTTRGPGSMAAELSPASVAANLSCLLYLARHKSEAEAEIRESARVFLACLDGRPVAIEATPGWVSVNDVKLPSGTPGSREVGEGFLGHGVSRIECPPGMELSTILPLARALAAFPGVWATWEELLQAIGPGGAASSADPRRGRSLRDPGPRFRADRHRRAAARARDHRQAAPEACRR